MPENTSLPVRSAVYTGPITDTSRWENFRPRADDIFICTPPKCGTTWTQAITAMLVFETHEHGLQPGVVSPWIDANFQPIEEYIEQIETQSHRRFIKTPYTAGWNPPFSQSALTLSSVAIPETCFFSLMNHQDNIADEELASSLLDRGANEF